MHLHPPILEGDYCFGTRKTVVFRMYTKSPAVKTVNGKESETLQVSVVHRRLGVQIFQRGNALRSLEEVSGFLQQANRLHSSVIMGPHEVVDQYNFTNVLISNALQGQ